MRYAGYKLNNEMTDNDFWKYKSLEQLSREEWEALCDGCGRCCLHKLEDTDSGELIYTNIVCHLFDNDSCRCSQYATRNTRVPDCLVLNAELVRTIDWLPDTCAYRLLREGEDLPWWHPLVSGSAVSVIEAGISVKDRTISERYVNPEDWQNQYLDPGQGLDLAEDND